MMTNFGLSGVAIRICSNIAAPGWLAIGSGSGIVAVTNTALVHEVNRGAIAIAYGNKQVTFTRSINSITLSGLTIREFGIFNLTSGGGVWSREGFPGITCDGSVELQYEVVWNVY